MHHHHVLRDQHISIEMKLEPGAIAPRRGSYSAAGFDLHAFIQEPIYVRPEAPAILVPTGVRLNMSRCHGLVGFVLPRSGLGHKQGLVLGNGTGVIDSDYQGEIFVSAWNRSPRYVAGVESIVKISPGDRIAQLVFLPTLTPYVTLVQVGLFQTETDRGERGFGSTGLTSERVSGATEPVDG